MFLKLDLPGTVVELSPNDRGPSIAVGKNMLQSKVLARERGRRGARETSVEQTSGVCRGFYPDRVPMCAVCSDFIAELEAAAR
jgi:hypothetical protein